MRNIKWENYEDAKRRIEAKKAKNQEAQHDCLCGGIPPAEDCVDCGGIRPIILPEEPEKEEKVCTEQF